MIDNNSSPIPAWSQKFAILIEHTRVKRPVLAKLIRHEESIISRMKSGRSIPTWDEFAKLLVFFIEHPQGLSNWQEVKMWVRDWNDLQSYPLDVSSDRFLIFKLYPKVFWKLVDWVVKEFPNDLDIKSVSILLSTYPADQEINPMVVRLLLEILDCKQENASELPKLVEQLHSTIEAFYHRFSQLREESQQLHLMTPGIKDSPDAEPVVSARNRSNKYRFVSVRVGILVIADALLLGSLLFRDPGNQSVIILSLFVVIAVLAVPQKSAGE